MTVGEAEDGIRGFAAAFRKRGFVLVTGFPRNGSGMSEWSRMRPD